VSNDNVVQEQEQQQVSENLKEADVVNDDATYPKTLQPSSQPKNSIDDEQEASIHQSLLNMLD
jgi:hypothetical protein